ncbi:unnamed protein product [Amoebophrya sp. A120]|nr:unnamed protein product [Amoebophrya sp. A120]|eukprot:GSA120T00023186001.1
MGILFHPTAGGDDPSSVLTLLTSFLARKGSSLGVDAAPGNNSSLDDWSQVDAVVARQKSRRMQTLRSPEHFYDLDQKLYGTKLPPNTAHLPKLGGGGYGNGPLGDAMPTIRRGAQGGKEGPSGFSSPQHVPRMEADVQTRVKASGSALERAHNVPAGNAGDNALPLSDKHPIAGNRQRASGNGLGRIPGTPVIAHEHGIVASQRKTGVSIHSREPSLRSIENFHDMNDPNRYGEKRSLAVMGDAVRVGGDVSVADVGLWRAGRRSIRTGGQVEQSVFKIPQLDDLSVASRTSVKPSPSVFRSSRSSAFINEEVQSQRPITGNSSSSSSTGPINYYNNRKVVSNSVGLTSVPPRSAQDFLSPSSTTAASSGKSKLLMEHVGQGHGSGGGRVLTDPGKEDQSGSAITVGANKRLPRPFLRGQDASSAGTGPHVGGVDNKLLGSRNDTGEQSHVGSTPTFAKAPSQSSPAVRRQFVSSLSGDIRLAESGQSRKSKLVGVGEMSSGATTATKHVAQPVAHKPVANSHGTSLLTPSLHRKTSSSFPGTDENQADVDEHVVQTAVPEDEAILNAIDADQNADDDQVQKALDDADAAWSKNILDWSADDLEDLPAEDPRCGVFYNTSHGDSDIAEADAFDVPGNVDLVFGTPPGNYFEWFADVAPTLKLKKLAVDAVTRLDDFIAAPNLGTASRNRVGPPGSAAKSLASTSGARVIAAAMNKVFDPEMKKGIIFGSREGTEMYTLHLPRHRRLHLLNYIRKNLRNWSLFHVASRRQLNQKLVVKDDEVHECFYMWKKRRKQKAQNPAASESDSQEPRAGGETTPAEADTENQGPAEAVLDDVVPVRVACGPKGELPSHKDEVGNSVAAVHLHDFDLQSLTKWISTFPGLRCKNRTLISNHCRHLNIEDAYTPTPDAARRIEKATLQRQRSFQADDTTTSDPRLTAAAPQGAPNAGPTAESRQLAADLAGVFGSSVVASEGLCRSAGHYFEMLRADLANPHIRGKMDFFDHEERHLDAVKALAAARSTKAEAVEAIKDVSEEMKAKCEAEQLQEKEELQARLQPVMAGRRGRGGAHLNARRRELQELEEKFANLKRKISDDATEDEKFLSMIAPAGDEDAYSAASDPLSGPASGSDRRQTDSDHFQPITGDSSLDIDDNGSEIGAVAEDDPNN